MKFCLTCQFFNHVYLLLLLLLGDISLNPGPLSNPQLFKQEWQAFGYRGLHLTNLNIYSLLLKIDQLRDIAKRTKAVMIGVLESKLNSTLPDTEIYNENYEILHFDRNRHREGVASYIRSDISYKLNSFLPNEIENITFNILMSRTKAITIGIIYRPLNQSKFLDIFEENLPKLNTSYCETYFLGYFNINLFENGKHVFDKSSSNNKNLDSFTKK